MKPIPSFPLSFIIGVSVLSMLAGALYGWSKLDKTYALVSWSGAAPTHIGHDAFPTYDECAAVRQSVLDTHRAEMINDTQYQCVPVWYVRDNKIKLAEEVTSKLSNITAGEGSVIVDTTDGCTDKRLDAIEAGYYYCEKGKWMKKDLKGEPMP